METKKITKTTFTVHGKNPLAYTADEEEGVLQLAGSPTCARCRGAGRRRGCNSGRGQRRRSLSMAGQPGSD